MNRLSSLLALVLVSATAFAADRPAGHCPFACAKPELVPARLRRIASLDWRQIDRAAIAGEWPEAPISSDHPGPGGMDGLALLLNSTACCCKTGQELAGAGFAVPGFRDRGPDSSGLWTVEVYLCRPNKKQAIDALNELVDAVVPEHPKSRFAASWDPSDDGQGVYAAAWDSGQERFVLEARTGPDPGRWTGSFWLSRRPPPGVLETWPMDDGSQVRVLRLKIDQSGHPREKVLQFAYLSECPIADRPCWSKEISAFWPRLRAKAEREGIRRVSLSVEDGALASTGFSARRGADGKWYGPSFFKY